MAKEINYHRDNRTKFAKSTYLSKELLLRCWIKVNF